MNRRPALGVLAASELLGALGMQIAYFVVPLAAIQVLNANAIEIGVLNLTDSAAALLTGFGIGALVDRIGGTTSITLAHTVRIAACVLLAVTLAMGPSLSSLFVAMFLVGAASLLNEAGTSMAVAKLAGRSSFQLNRANSLLRTSEIASSIGGPGLAALILVVSTSAAGALFGAFAFALAACCSGVIWVTSSRLTRDPSSRAEQNLVSEADGAVQHSSRFGGLMFIWRDPFLRPFTASSFHFNFFSAAFQAVFIIYCVRGLRFDTASIALVGVAAGIGGIAGAMCAALRFVESHAGGIYRMCLTTPAGCLVLMLLAALPLFDGASVALVASGEAIFAFAMVMCVVMSNTAVQIVSPPSILGRISASERVIAVGGEVPGAVIGGVIGTYVSVQAAMLVALVGMAFSTVWLVRVRAWPRAGVAASQDESDRVNA